MCRKSGKSIDHLLLYYEVATDLWVPVYCLFGIEWVMSLWVAELYASWRGQVGSCCDLEA